MICRLKIDGENYLIPIDARLKRERDVRREAVHLGEVLKFMEEAPTQVNIVIIDACRDNPFYRRWHRTRGSTSVRGLSQVDLPPEGTIIAFATAPGEFAEDGQGRRNSPFTSNLLKYIKEANLEVARMFRHVRADVLQETNSQQRPWYRESLIGSFFFNPTEEPPSKPLPNPLLDDDHSTDDDPPPPISGTNLISKATGVDYSPLRDLLEDGKWKDADVETRQTMLKAAGREKEEWLSSEDLDEFSCEDLRIIDQLWQKFSQGKFGFSVQKNIYQSQRLDSSPEFRSKEKVWERFGRKVGWIYSGLGGGWLNYSHLWLNYSDLTFLATAPSGQLPIGVVGALGRLGHREEGLGHKIAYDDFAVLVMRRTTACDL